MAGPIGRAYLFGDQPVAGFLVRHAQQGLGQAHQGQTLASAQAELLQEAFHHPLFLLAAAGVFDQGGGFRDHGGALSGVQWHAGQVGGDGFTLIAELMRVQTVPGGQARRREGGGGHRRQILWISGV